MPQVDDRMEAGRTEGGLTEAELAERAGTTPEQIRRLVDLGIIFRADGDRPFQAGAIQRVRLAETFHRSGIPLESIGQAIASGDLSFAFLDLLFPEPVGYSGKTYRELCADTGMTPGFVERSHEALGLPRPSMDDPVRQDDAEVLPMGQFILSAGVSEAIAIRALRVYGENIRRIAQAETQLYHSSIEEPMLRSGMSELQMRDLASQISIQLVPLVERMILWLYRRHQEHYITEHLLEHVEDVMEKSGIGNRRLSRPPAMVFFDLAGYTRLTEEQGDEAAAALAARLAELVQKESHEHGGRVVKWLGDGVMFHFPDPAEAVICSLCLVEQVPQAGLPPGHVGVNAGPVIFQDGDYYGRTVNLASRIASRAGPGQVLVTDEVIANARHREDLAFKEIGPVQLKGVAAPVMVHRAMRAS